MTADPAAAVRPAAAPCEVPAPAPAPGPGEVPAPAPAPGPGEVPAPAPAPGPGEVPAPAPAPGPGEVPAPAPPAALVAPAADPGLSREWQAPFPVDVPLTLSAHRHGGRDPAHATDRSGAVWRTSLTPDGPGTLCVRSRGAVVTARAWGPGAGWFLDRLPDWLGFHDDRAGFTIHDAVLSELALRFQGFRVGRTGRVFEALVPAVLEQKVVGREAHRAWRFLLLKYGEVAPGPAPAGMRVVPSPQAWARIPSWDWHRAGVEGVRARTIINAAAVEARLEEALDLSPAEADRRLRALPGIGVWTSAEIRQRAMGDPDAVSVGDYNLPGVVGWTLARRKADDTGMLELLAPYAGHRYRVTRLIELGGSAPPRRGPRMPIRDYRAF